MCYGETANLGSFRNFMHLLAPRSLLVKQLRRVQPIFINASSKIINYRYFGILLSSVHRECDSLVPRRQSEGPRAEGIKGWVFCLACPESRGAPKLAAPNLVGRAPCAECSRLAVNGSRHERLVASGPRHERHEASRPPAGHSVQNQRYWVVPFTIRLLDLQRFVIPSLPRTHSGLVEESRRRYTACWSSAR